MQIKNKTSIFGNLISFTIVLFTLLNIGRTFSGSDKTFVSLRVMPLHVTIGSSGDISLPEISPSFNTGEIQSTFSPGSFRLDDRKSSDSGYITTIQSSDLVSDNGIETNIISSENVWFKTLNNPSVIYGLPNSRVTFGTSIKNTRGSIGTPVVYFKRDLADNQGLIGRYGDTPSIKIIIPPAQSPGTYIGTIYFTLISG